MIRYCILSFILIGFSLTLQAQVSLGIHINRQQDNFGYGINIYSPFLLKDKMRFAVKANMSFIENTNDPNRTLWNSFYNFNAGFNYSFASDLAVKPYTELGAMISLTCPKFTDEKIHFGPYGLLGFAVPINKGELFFETGAVYTGAVAEKLNNRPTFVSGFTTTGGIRRNF